jgi:RNA recognition motif-containing protein
MAAYAFMQAMFPQMAVMLSPSLNGLQGTASMRLRCQDYDTRGYCTLGSSCPYEHGEDLIVAPRDDEYDPTRVNFGMNGSKTRNFRADSRTQNTRKALGGSQQLDAKRNNRAAFSDPRLPPDKDFNTVVVEQIPEGHFEDKIVRSFFSQYGKVNEVTMKPYKRLAIVRYDTHAAAKRAWESPKAVFDNRFVKVYWFRPDLERANITVENASSAKDANTTLNADAADDEAFKQQQAEKQKAYEERMRERKAMEDAKQDIGLRRENMAKERKALVIKLALAEGSEAGQRDSNGTKSGEHGIRVDSPDPKIKALRDQLARMQEEARSLGIDPDASLSEIPHAFGAQRRGFGGPMRGGFTSRAAYRGRGSPGNSQRGHGFVRGRDPAVRKLDNRPKNLVVSGVEFDNVKEENLRSYLTLIGPFEDIELNPQRMDSRIIVFKERWMAEQVMHGRSDIPGVGKVELCWVADTANGTPAPSTSGYGNGMTGHAGDEAKRTFSDEVPPPQDDNLDVAGGEDDDWGNIT